MCLRPCSDEGFMPGPGKIALVSSWSLPPGIYSMIRKALYIYILLYYTFTCVIDKCKVVCTKER